MHPFGVHYRSRERAEGEWTCDHEKEKEIATYNGCPCGAPICMPPQGACINGVGALPTPYGPTLRGAHNALRASKNKKEINRVDEVEPNQAKRSESNLGQNQREVGQYVRLYVHLPLPLPPPHPGQN